ncbi:RNA polymerase factor sigma-54 [Oceanobacillus kapialis]|uniref:RNA polymerase factor sigma-54 n=1 Tax=Oceanobacillus kapialis TaxID=481353 RepID=A0ABW5Q0G0_9BACI
MDTYFQQEQRLQRKMSQSLLQSLHVLQFSSVELMQYLKEIAEENPLIDQSKFADSFTDYIYNYSQSVLDANLWVDRERSMAEKLKEQLKLIKVPKEQVAIVEFGIDSLNDDGYLDISTEEWAIKQQVTGDQIQHALRIIHQLEPAGIGARNLTECIFLQLTRHTNRFDPYIEDLLQNHLDWVANEDITEIAVTYNISTGEAEERIEQIKACHPRPGQLLQPEKTSYIIPEATILKSEGRWHVDFFKWSTPKIVIDTAYQHVKKEQKEAYTFLARKHQEIEKLNRAFVYRTNTLERVIDVIIKKQWQYFDFGIHAIKALTLREVAEELDLHPSTVSRAVANKYVQTTNGVLPLKFFLQSGIKQRNGNRQASVAVKLLLKELVEHEKPTSPYSDEVLRDKLKREFGIDVARRTVMKYREQLNIPSSFKRKELT